MWVRGRKRICRLDARISDILVYTIRRRLLDRDLETAKSHIQGRVLELGASRSRPRRGKFSPPVEEAEYWICGDIEPRRDPDVVLDAQSLCFGQGSFDAVLCLEVLEYVRCPRTAFSEILRALSDGGVLVLSMPFMHRVDTPTDYWRFTANGLKVLLDETGFETKHIKQQGGMAAVVANFFFHAVRVIRNPWVRGALFPFGWGLAKLLATVDARLNHFIDPEQSFTLGYLVVARKPQGSIGRSLRTGPS